MEKPLFQKSKNAIRKPYKKPRSDERNSVQIRKTASKTLKKHYLEKVFVSRFRAVEKRYKANGKSTFSEVDKRYRKTL